jgi:hypothetical protein
LRIFHEENYHLRWAGAKRWFLVPRNITEESDIVGTVWSRSGDLSKSLQQQSFTSPTVSWQSSSNTWGQRTMSRSCIANLRGTK